jgi:hypothetical protein
MYFVAALDDIWCLDEGARAGRNEIEPETGTLILTKESGHMPSLHYGRNTFY